VRIATDLERLTGFVAGSESDIWVKHVQGDETEIALQTHYQVWWVKYCYGLLGRDDAIKLLSTQTRPRYLHVNPLKNGGFWNIPKAQQAFGQFLQNTSEELVYRLQAHPSFLSSQFSAGLFQIQDLASFLAVRAGDPQPGEKILDVCAAPGTKTCALAQFMMNRGSIVSVDISRSRFEAWKSQMIRMGVTIAEPVMTDARHLGIHDEFDLVLVDPPCSGSGVFDRNPRMKWHISPESLRHYSELQQEMLNEASNLVSRKGRLVYSTCSITTQENEIIISKFLKSHPQFETRPIISHSGSTGLGALSDARRFYPHRDGSAGYFIARLDQSET
jgi:16S rRNA (cytosine967-C5)-methyltransferase